MKTLILSRSDDPHSKTVAEHLRAMSVHVEFFRYEQLIDAEVAFKIAAGGARYIRDSISDLSDLSEFGSVWYRRPGGVVAGQLPQPWMARMVESESRYALDGMMQTLESALWVNHPVADFAASKKVFQLDAARKLGFNVPPTLVTNQPQLVAEFFEECHGKVIYKMVTEQSHAHIPAYEMPQGVPTLPLRKVDLNHLEQVRKSLHFFQKLIEKRYDLRVTVVGHAIFAVRIASQTGRGKLDWRHDYSVDMDEYELPEPVRALCIKLMQKLGLNYGAIDLCVDANGEYQFFEINNAGQYYWMEERLKVPISLEIAKLLARQSQPIVG